MRIEKQTSSSKIWKALTAIPAPAAEVQSLHIWCADLVMLVPEESALAELLDENEYAEIRRLRQPQDRQWMLLRRGLRRVVLGRYLNISPALLHFERGREGKPCLSGVAFNSSSSKNWMLLAMTRNVEVGVDVEDTTGFQFTPALAATCCNHVELGRITALPVAARAAEFLRVWTAKEAVLKLRGTGFRGVAELPSLLENSHAGERVVELQAGPNLIASLALAPLTLA